MTVRRFFALLAMSLALPVSAVLAQTIVGRDSAPARYNRLNDLAARPQAVIPPSAPDIFGTAAIGAGVTFYDARFRRVANADRDDPQVLDLAQQLRGLSPDEQLGAVHRLVTQRVRWVHDLDNVRVSDLWSNAGETLARGTGDSEDIAIVAMQVLKAAGFPARDLYLSIGRQKNVGAHVVLIARTDNGFTVIDDKLARPVPATSASLFTPVLTVGQGKSFIHGRRVGGSTRHASAR